MSDEGYLLDNQGSEAGQRFDALATRSTRPPGCGLALPQSVTVMLSADSSDYRNVAFCAAIARRCRRLARHRLRPLT
jgi:hypothetical protein